MSPQRVNHVKIILQQNKMKVILGVAFLITAVVASNLVVQGLYPITAIVTMWGAIICSLQCFLMTDARAHEYHSALLAARQAEKKVLP